MSSWGRLKAVIRFNGHWRTASSLALGAALAAFSSLGPALANESLSNTDIFLGIRTDNAAIDTLNKTYGKNTLYFAASHKAKDTAPMRIAFNRIPDVETEV